MDGDKKIHESIPCLTKSISYDGTYLIDDRGLLKKAQTGAKIIDFKSLFEEDSTIPFTYSINYGEYILINSSKKLYGIAFEPKWDQPLKFQEENFKIRDTYFTDDKTKIVIIH